MSYYNAGKKELFSVCCSTCTPSFKSGWMAVNLFLDNHLIGANEEITQIDTFLNMINVKLADYDLDYADSLRNLDKSVVLSQIEQGYEHSQNWIDSSKIGALFLSLNLTPCLDGDVVVLLMLETTDRVIWRAHDDDVVREIFLPPGYVKNTLNDVINFSARPKTMIDSFETTLLEVLGLVADFDPEYAQWSCKLTAEPLWLELVYSLDGTVSTSLYLDDRLLAFNYASGLQCLSISEDEISCDIMSGSLRRTLTINTNSLRVRWQDL